jgi:4-hydroxybenzoate polyprenyltransferase
MALDLASPLARVRTYASFVRLEHTLFSLPLLLAGVFSVPGPPLTTMRWLLIGLAAVSARTAAMALNRVIDRRLDALNPRTRGRELPSGRMRGLEAGLMLAVSVMLYLAACAALGRWYVKVAWIPLFIFGVYPYLKRFTALCHVGVGVALALAPLAGYAAAHPDLASPQPAIALAIFALFWVTGFDIIYATLDEAFDREHGIHSLVASLGRSRALRVSAVLHGLAAFALLIAGFIVLVLGPTAIAGPWTMFPVLIVWGAVALLLYLEQRWAEDVNLAFFTVNVWVGLGVLVEILVARLCGGGFGWRAT